MDDIDTSLNNLRRRISLLQQQPGVKQLGIGVREMDWALCGLGKRWLAEHRTELDPANLFAASDIEQRPDVFIASELYPTGGHTALIGDFVRAIPHTPPPILLVTDPARQADSGFPLETTSRTAIAPERIEILRGLTLAERLDHLVRRLVEIRPRRVFLFQHPDDSVPVAAVQPALMSRCFLVHHADGLPSFGLHLPGIQIIDLTPSAAAMTRLQGLTSDLLLLTAPDPGPRPNGFLRRGRLVTASSGSENKFTANYALTYAEAVAVILRTTSGWHVHIGPLCENAMNEIEASLKRHDLAPDRFVHIPRVSSLATGLWEHECDVYFASFPIGGARANAEVLASATPHLRHSSRPNECLVQDSLRPEGGLVWRAWEDLAAVVRRLSHRDFLEEKSKQMRAAYEKFHHPLVFAQKLNTILTGAGGWQDDQRDERDRFAANRAIMALATDLQFMLGGVGSQPARE